MSDQVLGERAVGRRVRWEMAHTGIVTAYRDTYYLVRDDVTGLEHYVSDDDPSARLVRMSDQPDNFRLRERERSSHANGV